jgi:ATP-dependent RNA helicase SUPV3L1/SUV3
MMKPAAAELTVTLFALKYAPFHGLDLDKLPELPRPGLTSGAADANVPEAYYRAYGFHLCGPRAVRLDILERLADIIRPLLAWRQKSGMADTPPKGATGDGGFRATEEMMSILGTSAGELGNVLNALGFRTERRAIPAAQTVQVTAQATDANVAKWITPEVSAPAEETSVTGISPEVEATPASVDAPVAGDTTAVADEPKFEDIWRPRRHQRAEKPERTEPRREHHRRSSHKHSGLRPESRHAGSTPVTPEGATGAIAAEGQSVDQAKPQSGEHRPGGNKHGADRGERRERNRDGDRDRQPKPQTGDRARDQKGGGDKRDRPGGSARFDKGPRFDKGRREDNRRQPEVITASPPKRSGVDPDNPFAKLAALKVSLDKRGEGAGS